MGLSLSVVGVYRLDSMPAVRTATEIPIRRPLGASPGRLTQILAHRVLWPLVPGLATGPVLALCCGGFPDRLMYRISPSDPVTTLVAVVLLPMPPAGPAFIPMRRALRADLVEALRVE